jgi:hypothetical protein
MDGPDGNWQRGFQLSPALHTNQEQGILPVKSEIITG